jgi:hypothetical protein
MFRPGLALLLATLALPAAAEIFKWTDAAGKVHYGDQPPENVVSKEINPRTSKASEARAEEARRKAAEGAVRKRLDQEKTRETDAKQQAAREEEARRRAENCQRARGNLDLLQRANMRLTTVDPQGRSQVLDAAAREAELARARQTITENCVD